MNSNWDWNKFKQGLLNLQNAELWGKDITQLINIRKLVIYGIIIAGFAGYWYWQGKKTKPISIDCDKIANLKVEVPCSYSKGDKHKVEFRDGKMYFDDVSIKAGQVPDLKPYKFQFKPFVTAGISAGDGKVEKELGLGVSVAQFYRLDLNGYLTDKGFYGGVGYRVTNNSSLILGYGKDYKNLKEKVNVGLKWSF